ncbi:hypothetical protein [Paraburkholderia humisilvae]|uniref:Uncharacterized protein n=2 Tax=Paraburkholderia humisilvae TaxID=627669 RepID=A0A6J5F5Y1_9BURK|nr:hypothetical protein LMG29542_07432 [Paraburkholderia humisilvae]
MEHSDFLNALHQLAAAADILAKAGPEAMRTDAIELQAVFRKHDEPDSAIELNDVTFDDRLFVQTAQAALTLAGRNEFAASRALLEQARSLLHIE